VVVEVAAAKQQRVEGGRRYDASSIPRSSPVPDPGFKAQLQLRF